MVARLRPLWEILVDAADASSEPLDCDECFAILEALADIAALVRPEVLRQMIQRHLARCPDCREHHLKRLKELEIRWTQHP